jgi:hypothetical protein
VTNILHAGQVLRVSIFIPRTRTSISLSVNRPVIANSGVNVARMFTLKAIDRAPQANVLLETPTERLLKNGTSCRH